MYLGHLTREVYVQCWICLQEGRVTFTTTLFALIRDNLKINVRESAEMDQVKGGGEILLRGGVNKEIFILRVKGLLGTNIGT